MANANTAYGLRPIGLVGNGVNSTGVTQYEIASNNTNAIYQYGIVEFGIDPARGQPSMRHTTGRCFHRLIRRRITGSRVRPGSGFSGL